MAYLTLLGVTSTGLYWSMIESAFGLVAACLPTMYALFKRGFAAFVKKTPRSRSGSMSSNIRIIPNVGRTTVIDSYAMKDLDHIEQRNGQIFVKKTIDRSEDMA